LSILINKRDKLVSGDKNTLLIKVEYKGKESLSYKDKINTKIGTITYSYNKEIISTEDIILTKELKPSYIKILLKYKFYIVGAFISITLIFILIKIKKHLS
jgi:hypothetical protein